MKKKHLQSKWNWIEKQSCEVDRNSKYEKQEQQLGISSFCIRYEWVRLWM